MLGEEEVLARFGMGTASRDFEFSEKRSDLFPTLGLAWGREFWDNFGRGPLLGILSFQRNSQRWNPSPGLVGRRGFWTIWGWEPPLGTLGSKKSFQKIRARCVVGQQRGSSDSSRVFENTMY